MAVVNLTVSIIVLNMYGLNNLMRSQRFPGWRKKQNPAVCCLQETHFRFKDTNRYKVKGWKKIQHANSNHREAGITAMLM